MKQILNNLFEHKTLSKETAKEVLVNIASAKYNISQVASFMSVYLMRSITVEELSGFREAMLELCLKIEFDTNESIDIVGTGGDGKNTFNISTLSCFLAAGAGIKVTKHGNYGVSSVSGSSNVLERIGVKFTNDVAVLNKYLNEAGICFMHAPLFHPAMKNVAPVRKDLGVRTFFNLLGPLTNPARPRYLLLGTYNLEIMRLYNYLMQGTDHEYTIIHALDGFDEISLTGEFKMISKHAEQIVEPEQLGLSRFKEEELSGGNSVDDAAKIFMDILNGKGTKAQNEAVVANAGIAIHCVKPNLSLQESVELARESLRNKKALNVYNKLIKLIG